MRLQFIQTRDEFREAQQFHKLVSSRPHKSIKLIASAWQVGTAFLTGIIAAIYHPWDPAYGQVGWLAIHVFMPMFPWTCVFAYLFWFQLRTAREDPLTLPPWQQPRKDRPNPVRKPWISKVVRAAAINCLSVVWVMLCAFYLHALHSNDAFASMLFGWAIGGIPWVVFMIYAAQVSRTLFDRQIKIAWNQQTHLHEPHLFDFEQSQVALEVPESRTVFQWIAFQGIVETPHLFLLYRNRALFHIIPKRAFSSPELLDAFRHMVAVLAGRQPSRFEVLPVGASPDSHSTRAAVLPEGVS